MESQNPPPECETRPSNLLDSSKTLDQETGSLNSCTSSISIFAAELLDDSDPRELEIEGDDDELINLSPLKADFNFKPLDSYWRPYYTECSRPKPLPSTAVVGAGLANLGNTCFLNAVLQCFIHTVPLLNGILSDTYSEICTCDNGGFCLPCTLRELVELSLASTNRVVSPYKLVDNLSYFSSSFQRFQQEDAHEFLQCFLDKFGSCCDVKKDDNVSLQRANFVKQVFGGSLISKVKCLTCGHLSETPEPSVDLSLEIEGADNLLTALQSFTKIEKIDDSENFTCEGCKEQVSIEKQLTLDHAPSVASFHLKRFKHEGSFVQKIDKHVSFPEELDLLPFTASGNASDAELMYRLFAIVVHTGLTSTSGHYHCFVRLSPDMWCKFDDCRVLQVSEEFVLSQEAYILFYAKKSISWFSNFIETKISRLTSAKLSTSPKSVLDNVEAAPLSPALQEKISVDSNEVSDSSGSINLEVGNIDNKGSEPKLYQLKSNRGEDYLHKTSNSVKPANGSSDVALNGSQKVVSPSLLDKATWTQDTSSVVNTNTKTPVRSPSPEIYREDPRDVGFSVEIPRDHLKLVDSVSCKRKLEKDMEDDLETWQACQFIKKSIPGSRGRQLMAAMRGSKSEGSVKKKSRLGGPLSRDNGSTDTRHSSGIRLLHPLVAGTSR